MTSAVVAERAGRSEVDAGAGEGGFGGVGTASGCTARLLTGVPLPCSARRRQPRVQHEPGTTLPRAPATTDHPVDSAGGRRVFGVMAAKAGGEGGRLRVRAALELRRTRMTKIWRGSWDEGPRGQVAAGGTAGGGCERPGGPVLSMVNNFQALHRLPRWQTRRSERFPAADPRVEAAKVVHRGHPAGRRRIGDGQAAHQTGHSSARRRQCAAGKLPPESGEER